MKKLENLVKVVSIPDTTFFGAYYYDGRNIELCDDIEEFEEDGEKTFIHVQDKIIDGILYKKKELKVTKKDGRAIVEKTECELPLDINTMLIYVMYEGFVQTKSNLVSIDKAIERYELLKSPEEEKNDTKRV